MKWIYVSACTFYKKYEQIYFATEMTEMLQINTHIIFLIPTY